MGSTDGPASQNRTLVITLSTVLSAVGLFLVFATAFACFRVKHGRLPFLKRGITPIDDEEIESWKRRAGEEKFTGRPAGSSPPTSPARSLKKSPSVIVYQSNAAPQSGEDSGASVHEGAHGHSPSHPQSYSHSHSHSLARSYSQTQPLTQSYSHPHSYSHSHSHSIAHSFSTTAHPSLDLPPAAVLARAPNSRPGLTDETVEGDAAFIPTHRRQGSRLSKKHSRGSSSQWGPVTPRQSGEGRASRSSEWGRRGESRGREGGHARIYSDSSVPPRLSLDEGVIGGLAPAPVRVGRTPVSEIGRAIG